MNSIDKHNEANKQYYKRNRERILKRIKEKRLKDKPEHLQNRIGKLHKELERCLKEDKRQTIVQMVSKDELIELLLKDNLHKCSVDEARANLKRLLDSKTSYQYVVMNEGSDNVVIYRWQENKN